MGKSGVESTQVSYFGFLPDKEIDNYCEGEEGLR
jgi:hypothetical protein